MIPKFCPSCNFKLDESKLISWGGWSYDENSRRLFPEIEERFIRISNTEGAIIAALLRAEGRRLNKSGALYAAVCGVRPDQDWPDIKVVDVYISKIRRKLRAYYGTEAMISTHWGVGYYAVEHGVIPDVPKQTGSHRRGRPRRLFLCP